MSDHGFGWNAGTVNLAREQGLLFLLKRRLHGRRRVCQSGLYGSELGIDRCELGAEGSVPISGLASMC